ncbi:MAG: UDP-3-O-[3-hydroxymyristoyl] N-acetylglucosamine deacetylase [Candidatus Omnitrophica bacterium]|nr:UDP-3-O-[3-hydroxymyristoyl] N-acetylglucosamine deacetylase [Candidatus Omnitrophota bacterium]
MRHQRTIKNSVIFKGKGIHTGRECRVAIHKAEEDSGIFFTRTDIGTKAIIPASVAYLYGNAGSLRCTGVEKSGARVMTIEHLLAALSCLDIDNASIDIDSEELPAMDGSALDYASDLNKAGSVEQKSNKRELALDEAIFVKDDKAILMAVPSEAFSVSYALSFAESGINQFAEFTYKDSDEKKELFMEEIAPARTFCKESEVADILKNGLGKGGDYNNTLVIRDGMPLNNEYRLPYEPARHKILDILGDLALLNRDIKAQVIGIKSGHTLNLELVKRLSELI